MSNNSRDSVRDSVGDQHLDNLARSRRRNELSSNAAAQRQKVVKRGGLAQDGDNAKERNRKRELQDHQVQPRRERGDEPFQRAAEQYSLISTP